MGRPRKEDSQAKIEDTTTEVKSTIDFSLIDKAILDIKKTLGEEVVINTDEIRKIPRVKLDSPNLGYIMGDGGCPRGRLIEIYGPESSGKSLLCQFIGSNFQRDDLFVAYVDTEHTFDPEFANIIGLKTTSDKFKLFQPDCGEDAFTVCEKLAQTGQVGLIIMDSIAAMTPKSELEGEMTDQQMGAQARMMGKGLRKITSIINRTKTTVIFVNQLRMKIGVTFGNPETTPGGNALKFFASIRLDVRKTETVDGNDKDKDDAEGIKSRVKCVKNKTSVAFRKCEMFFNFKNGVDFYREYLDFAVSLEIVSKGGAWYSYKGERWQGANNFVNDLRNRFELFKEIKDQVDTILSNDPLKKVELPETAEVSSDVKDIAAAALDE